MQPQTARAAAIPVAIVGGVLIISLTLAFWVSLWKHIISFLLNIGTWDDVWKYIVPPIITGLVAITGLFVAFKFNDRMKRLEIVYKEQLESVKYINGIYGKFAQEIRDRGNINKPPDVFREYINEFRTSNKNILMSHLVLLGDRSRFAILGFGNRMSELVRIREELDEHFKVGSKNPDNRKSLENQYDRAMKSIIEYAFTVTDVLIDDLRLPRKNELDRDIIRRFNKDYKAGLEADVERARIRHG